MGGKRRATVIDGEAEAKKIRDDISAEVSRMKESLGVVPGLAVIHVGERDESATYVRKKEEACKLVGISSYVVRLPSESSEDEVLNYILGFNSDPSVHGILVQLPLPSVSDYPFSITIHLFIYTRLECDVLRTQSHIGKIERKS